MLYICMVILAWAENLFMHDPEDIGLWWDSAGMYTLGETVYTIKDRSYSDGLCTVHLGDGFIVPIFSGGTQAFRRIVGFVYRGKGALSLRFPHRGSAWFFANYMHQFGQLNASILQPIAQQKNDYEVEIEQGIVFSTHPQLEALIYNLKPVAKGEIILGREGSQ